MYRSAEDIDAVLRFAAEMMENNYTISSKISNSLLSTIMKITIDLPERSSLDVDERYAKEALVAALYSNGKLSGHEARRILGMTRRAFEEMLPRYGFSILVDSSENIET